MNVAEFISAGYGDPGMGAAAAAVSSGWSFPTLDEAVTTATNLFGAAAGVVSSIDNYKFTQQQRNLNLLQQSSAIDLQKTMTQAQVDIAKAQAQAAVQRAQSEVQGNGFAANMGQDFSTVLGNINSRIGGSSSSANLMLWLTIAGVGVAVLQFVKSKK